MAETPVRTEETEIIINESGEVVKEIEHFRQGDHYYRIVHDRTSVVDEGEDYVPKAIYSKLKILIAARQAGFLPDLISMLEASPETKYIWDASNTIEDNELLAAYLPAVAEAIGKTPEEVRAFLDQNCLAD